MRWWVLVGSSGDRERLRRTVPRSQLRIRLEDVEDLALPDHPEVL